jgi:hypothetical protein
VHVLRGQTQDPLGHAAHWNEGYAPSVVAQRLDQWVEYYGKLRIKALTVGAVILRRRSTHRPWRRSDDLPKKFIGSCSDHLLRVTQAEDFLAGLSGDDELFDSVFTVALGHKLHQTMVHESGTFAVRRIELELEGGLGFSANLDPASFQLLRRCDGRRSLRGIVSELATLGNLTFNQVCGQASRVVRELVRGALLVPVGGTRAVKSQPPSGGFEQAASVEHAPGSSRT